MSAKFYTLLTEIGAAKLASAAALGVPLKITKMAVGDGGGVLPTPSAQQNTLIAEQRRADLNMLYIDPQNSSQIIAEQVIPETEGGWWIREVGLFDETGALIAVGNCPESYKPQLAEGSGRTQTVRMVLITSSTDNITLKIDPAVVLATRKYVDDKVLELKLYVDDQMAKHIAAADPHTQYAPKESPTLTGAPKAPTAAAGTNTTQIATTAFVQAVVTVLNNALALKAPLASPALTGTPTAPTAAQTVNNTQVATTAFVKTALAALVGSSPAALDTLNELAAALGNDPNFATTMTNALAGKQPLDSTLTALSGKSVDALLQYLGLKSAALRDVGTASGQIPDMRAFSSGGSGNAKFTKLPDGTVIQRGNASVPYGGATITLPTAMPSANYVVLGMDLDGTVGSGGMIAGNPLTATTLHLHGINWNGGTTNDGSPGAMCWMAISL
ncbi:MULTISPECIES: phage tail protein [Escherichia]|uniref:phage tail protein n=1 Tax=Escherichia TaxID=561 RepID=UPI000DE0A849|nr:phage tail protein [Escherichia coli]AZW03546.1 phage tail protein [Escherichia coli]EKY0831821.1 phage tail protein [Escherichia coli]MCA7492969.1 phage tail protein [Escherichia coli]RLY32602.1 phage tail protein [Escherichia coli]HDC9027207.1 phage tail protein [Escherichia coli]